jgi:hypothetical protein
MKSTAEIGLKISGLQREFCRCTGKSAEAEMERRGLGASRVESSWVVRQTQERPEGRATGSQSKSH